MCVCICVHMYVFVCVHTCVCVCVCVGFAVILGSIIIRNSLPGVTVVESLFFFSKFSPMVCQ